MFKLADGTVNLPGPALRDATPRRLKNASRPVLDAPDEAHWNEF